MKKKFAVAIMLAATGALPALLPAWAQGFTCTAPVLPASVDPAKATEQQLRGLLAAAQGFITASGGYQACLDRDLQALKDQAKTDSKPLDPAIEAAVKSKIAANQKDKEKVGSDADLFVTAFKKFHACEGKPLASCQN